MIYSKTKCLLWHPVWKVIIKVLSKHSVRYWYLLEFKMWVLRFDICVENRSKRFKILSSFLLAYKWIGWREQKTEAILSAWCFVKSMSCLKYFRSFLTKVFWLFFQRLLFLMAMFFILSLFVGNCSFQTYKVVTGICLVCNITDVKLNQTNFYKW